LGCVVQAVHPESEPAKSTVSEDGFRCRQCGHCCINVSGAFSACATDAELESGGAGGDAMNTFCQGCGMPMKKDPEIGDDAKPYQERDTAKALREARS
jgi:hypothetical protein